MRCPPSPSRRGFLATSALGLIGLARPATLTAARAHASEELLYVGTYTDEGRREGVHLVRFDTGSGDLQLVRSFDVGPNPSFLAIHPNGRWLYLVNEVNEPRETNGTRTGDVSAFAISPETADLTRLNAQRTRGGSPCYVSVDRRGRVVFVANYMGGNVVVLPIEDGGGVAPVEASTANGGSTGPNAARQEAPHAHCVVTDPSNRFVLMADLGLDRVFLDRLDADRIALTPTEGRGVRLRPGAGPRHLAFHPRLPLVYVANELDSTVTTLRLDAERETLTVVDTRSTLPAGSIGENSVADIHVAPDGRALYVSNRGHDSVAVFAVGEDGGLTLEQVASCEGDWPRNFSLDPTGRWLLVANQRSNDIVVLRREEAAGTLQPTGKRLAVAAPVCVRFRAHAGVTT
jgi:6-phosphogluconolactonase